MMGQHQKQAATLEQTVELLHEIREQQTELGKRFTKIERCQEQLQKEISAIKEQVSKLEENWRVDSRALSAAISAVDAMAYKVDGLHRLAGLRADERIERYQAEMRLRRLDPPADADEETDPAIRTPGTRDTIPSGPMGGEE